MSVPSARVGSFVAIPILGLVIAILGSRVVRTKASSASIPEPSDEVPIAPIDESVNSERQPAEVTAAEPVPVSAAEPEEIEPSAGAVDERKLDWLRSERAKLEDMIATADDLEDRRLWNLVQQLVGPTYSCALEKQGRGVPIERASATQLDGSHGVSSDGHDLVYLGFGMAFHMDYSEFPCMKELLDTAGALSGFPSDGELSMDADALATRLALFCARIDSEL